MVMMTNETAAYPRVLLISGLVRIQNTRTNVAMTSVTIFHGMARIAGEVQKIPRVPELSSLLSNCSLKAAQHNQAPTKPPSSCAAQYTGTDDHGTPPEIATAKVTAGLICAPEGAAILAPAKTPKPQPSTMINQSPPPPCENEFFSTTAATDPLPSRHSTAVPKNSQTKMSIFDTEHTLSDGPIWTWIQVKCFAAQQVMAGIRPMSDPDTDHRMGFAYTGR